MKKLLLTGGSGFLGKSIIPYLKTDYEVKTLGFDNSEDYFVDLSKSIPKFLTSFDIVIHAAGKVHSVPKTLNEDKIFFDINLNGTKNLCTALEINLPKSLIFISTVAVYGKEDGNNIDEDFPLNGSTPYALSKIQSEEFLQAWCKKNNVVLGILRPSLIAGKNPPGNLGAMINGIKTGKYFRIGKGQARKSVLMAEDIARLIPAVENTGGTFNVCDNHHPSFAELEDLISQQLNIKPPKTIPSFAAKSIALMGDIIGNKFPINSDKLVKITRSLTFSNEKAKKNLGWEPLDVLQNFKIS
jgi:nucleoside-diphosphate-sugar epimerase